MSDRASLTILVVDDDESMLPLTATILRRVGYQVLTARDGLEALEPGLAAP